jgi:hypothetical protein
MGSRSEDNTVDGEDVSTLIERMKEFPGRSKRSSNDGGTVREKGSCKCCGARVDVGTHQCGVCQQAGCSPWKKLCKFA